MSISIKSTYYLLFILPLLLLAGCLDDRLIYQDNNYKDGVTVLNLEANFRPFTEGDLTRAEGGNGKALADIRTLHILVFNTDGKLLPEYTQTLTKDKFTVKDSDRASQDNNPIAETSTKSVSDISLKLPFGEYYIIGVANPKSGTVYDRNTAATLDDLFNSKVIWEENESGDISNNGEMLGYFCDSREGSVWPSSISEIKTVKVNRPGMTLSAWMRRCASKITIDFDGSQLREGVTVYIKQAKIYDIPYDCTLGFGSGLSSTGDGATGEVSAEGNPSETGKTSYNNSVSSEDYGKAGGFFGPSKQVISYLKEETSATRAEDTANSSVTTPTDDYDGWENWPSVTKASPYLYDENDKVNFHSETAQALYFYENMQDNSVAPKKTKTALLDFEGGGMKYNPKDGMDYGSYIEVEAYYQSEATNNVSQGVVRYRFMLGKNATDNFEAERNYHYKLTLKLKGNGNDGDWHIDFKEQVLEVTPLKEVNYQGKFFVPTEGIANMGHTFSPDNVITVTSYMDYLSDAGQTTQLAEAWTMSYLETDDETGKYPEGEKAVYKNGLPSWIEYKFKEDNVNSATHQLAKELVFTTKMRTEDDGLKEVDIKDDLKKYTLPTSPYNLSNSEGKSEVEETANCYIVKGSGTYRIPLVYGNAVTDSKAYEQSYKTNAMSFPNANAPNDANGLYCDNPDVKNFALSTLKNYLNKDISSPYIEKDCGTPDEAVLVWQDAPGLIKSQKYEPDCLTTEGGKIGAIEFTTADNTSIQEGNAVLAIKKDGKIMWSWHIWVTNFSSLEETMKIEFMSGATGASGITDDTPKDFEILPVNLGWCSGNEKIRYYPERRCKIRFTAGTRYQEIELVQRSHMAFPRGNNVYYQWGRKDPFWGGDQNGNKQIYPAGVADEKGNPKRFYADGDDVTTGGDLSEDQTKLNHKRQTTYFLFQPTSLSESDNKPDNSDWYFDYNSGNRLIQQPAMWHNPPRKEDPNNSNSSQTVKKYISQNVIYYNLWGQINRDNWVYAGVKTVYDPTPPGYIVPHYALFSSFTYTGGIVNGSPISETPYKSSNWYEVSPENIPPSNYLNGNEINNLFEFYTSKSKLQSVIFPMSGYRDWDATAKIIDMAQNHTDGNSNEIRGFVWTRMMQGYDWGTLTNVTAGIGCTFGKDKTEIVKKEDGTEETKILKSRRAESAYNFQFSRSQKEVWPNNQFNTCDGMPIRPMKIVN